MNIRKRFTPSVVSLTTAVLLVTLPAHSLEMSVLAGQLTVAESDTHQHHLPQIGVASSRGLHPFVQVEETPPETTEMPEVPPESTETPPEMPEVPPESTETPPEMPEVPPESTETPPEMPEVPPESTEMPPETPEMPETPPEDGTDSPETDDPPPCKCCYCYPDAGMLTYRLRMMEGGLRLHDRPLSYRPAYGPDVPMVLTYQDTDPSNRKRPEIQPLGPQWSLNWLQFMVEYPPVPEADGQPGAAGFYAVLHGRGAVVRSAGISSGTAEGNGVRVGAKGGGSQSSFLQRPDGTVKRDMRAGRSEEYGNPAELSGGFKIYPMTSYTDPKEGTVTLDWTGMELNWVEDATGRRTTFTYSTLPDGKRRITAITDPFGRTATISYYQPGQTGGAPGMLKSITDPLGITSTVTYDETGRAGNLTTPLGSTNFMRETLDGGNGRALVVTDALGQKERVEKWKYHAGLQPALEAEAGWAGSNPTLTHDVTLHWSKRAMHEAGALEADPLHATLYNWNSGQLPSSIRRPLMAREHFGYTAPPMRLASRTTLNDNGTTRMESYQWNGAGELIGYTDPMNRTTVYEYDATGRNLTKVTRYAPGGTEGEVVAQFANYAGGRPQLVTDAAGNQTAVAYNAGRQPVQITDAAGNVTKLTYGANDAPGVLTAVTRAFGTPLERTVSYTHDEYERVATVSTPGDGTITYHYDAIGGNPLASLDQLVEAVYPDGTSERVELLAALPLRVSDFYDRLGRRTRYEHNALGQVARVEDPAGRVIQYGQDQCCGGSGGPITSLIDARGRETRWERDVAGRLVAKVIDGMTVANYVYRQHSGRLWQVTDANGNRKEYVNGVDGQTTGVNYLALGEGVAPTANVAFGYDGHGRLVSMSDGSGETAWTYHAVGQPGAGRVASEVKTAGGAVVSALGYSYDALGRVGGRSVGLTGEMGTESYTHDALGRLETMTNPLSQMGGAAVPFEWRYEGPGGRLSEVRFPNGMRTALGYGTEAEDRQLASMTHWKAGDAGTYAAFDYAWDDAGRLMEWGQTDTLTNGEVRVRRASYGYDAADQLTSAVWRDAYGVETQRREWSYDAMGNRTQETGGSGEGRRWGANGFNQLTGEVGVKPVELRGTVDRPSEVKVAGQAAEMNGLEWSRTLTLAAGENEVAVEARELEGSNGAAQTAKGKVRLTVEGAAAHRPHSYDGNGNLLSDGIRSYEWDAENRLVAVSGAWGRSELGYDGMWRRVKLVEKDASGAVVGERRFTWDHLRMVEERDGNGAVAKRFWGVGEERVVTLNSQPSTLNLTYLRDHLGSVRALVDETGAVRARYTYDEWGVRTKIEGDMESDFGFTGHFEHGPSGLTLAPYRGYDAGTGRWLSRDPIGENGGLNVYGYVENHPIGFTDPTGLFAFALPWVLPALGDLVITGLAACGLWKIGEVMAEAQSSGFPPGFWPGDQGSKEWGRRNGHGAQEGKRRFHGIKQDDKGSKAPDDYGVNPETGDVIAPDGEIVGNLEDAPPK